MSPVLKRQQFSNALIPPPPPRIPNISPMGEISPRLRTPGLDVVLSGMVTMVLVQ